MSHDNSQEENRRSGGEETCETIMSQEFTEVVRERGNNTIPIYDKKKEKKEKKK